MSNVQRYIKALMGLVLAATLSPVYAGAQPKFSIVALIKPPTQITTSDTVIAAYLVTNRTLLLRTLTMVPLNGVTQNTVAPNSCQNPFVLNSGQSCVLVLSIAGGQVGLGNKVNSGPVICKTLITDNQTPDRFLCSQPALGDILNVAVV